MAKKKGTKKRSTQPPSGVSSGTTYKILGGSVVVLLLLAALSWSTVSRILERMRVGRAEKAIIATLNEQSTLVGTVNDRDSANAVAKDFGALQADLLTNLENLKSVRASSSMAAEEMAARVERFETEYEEAEQPVFGAERKMPPDAWQILKQASEGTSETRIAELRNEVLPKRQAATVAQKEQQAGFLAEMEQRKKSGTLGPAAGGLGQGAPALGQGSPSPPGTPAATKPAAPARDPSLGSIPGQTSTIGLGPAKPPAPEVPLDHAPESDFLKEKAERAVTVTILGVDAKDAALMEKLTSKVGAALESENMKGQSGDAGRFYLFVELEDFAATSKLSSVGEIVKTFPEKRLIVVKVDPATL
jgi:hypothetical protein